MQEASSDPSVAESIRRVMAATGLTRLESVPVVHCRFSYGVVLESSTGWKFVFSGDTRPCPQVAAAAKGATILVHEVSGLQHLPVPAADPRLHACLMCIYFVIRLHEAALQIPAAAHQ